MAKNASYLIANPTPATITIGAVSIASNQVKSVTWDEEAHAAYLAELVAKGCVVAPAGLTGTSWAGTVTDLLDNPTTLVQKGARMLLALVRAVHSVNGDSFAEKGL